MTVRLRLYTADDEDDAIALWQRSWQAAYPDIDFAERLPWWRARWRNELTPHACIVVAEQNAILSGFITVDTAGYVEQLVVAPEHWDQEIAASLMAEAKRISPSQIELQVNADNARALRFYTKHGFDVVHDDVNPHSGKAVHVMRWTPEAQ